MSSSTAAAVMRGALRCILFAAPLLAPAYAQQTVDRPPRIAGAPRLAVHAHDYYGFKPWARDPEGRALRFRIANKPHWAKFQTTTGRLHGRPRQPGQWRNIRIGVSDGRYTMWLPRFTLTVLQAAHNAPPRVSGAPPRSVRPGALYVFAPRASDVDGDVLRYAVTNKPDWARFDPISGVLSGVPRDADRGEWRDIRISVSDGRRAAALPPFAITVTPYTYGSVALRWAPATDAETQGYFIHYGASRDALIHTLHINDSITTYHVVEGLEPATYYFALRGYAASGAMSELSNVVEATVVE